MSETLFNEVKANFLDDSTPMLYSAEHYPDVSAEQYEVMNRFVQVARASFYSVQLEDGTWVLPDESRYLWLVDLQPDVAALPETTRTGLLGFAFRHFEGVFAQDFDPSENLTFMQEYFELSKDHVEFFAKYFLSIELSSGVDPHIPRLIWISKAFPELLSHDELVALFRDDEIRSVSLGRRLTSHMFHGEPKGVEVLQECLDIAPEFIQFHAWEAFVQNSLGRISSSYAAETTLEELISHKYLRYFTNRDDLAREVLKTKSEFEELLASDSVSDNIASYRDAVKTMQIILDKC